MAIPPSKNYPNNYKKSCQQRKSPGGCHGLWIGVGEITLRDIPHKECDWGNQLSEVVEHPLMSEETCQGNLS